MGISTATISRTIIFETPRSTSVPVVNCSQAGVTRKQAAFVNSVTISDTASLPRAFRVQTDAAAIVHGTLAAISSADAGVTWTGTFTPTDNIEDTTSVITVGTTLTDIAGNAPLSGNSTANYTIDTIEPVVTSVVMSDSALLVGETSTLTITFSEAVTGFDNTDITLSYGTDTAVNRAGAGVTWTGTITTTANIEDTTNVITVVTT